MTPQEKKDKMLAKLNEEPTPVMTQVVRVEKPKQIGRPAKPKEEQTEHFNVHLPVSLASDLRMHKARSRVSLQDIIIESVRSYLKEQNALTV